MYRWIFMAIAAVAAFSTPASAQVGAAPCRPFQTFPLSLNLGSEPLGAGGENVRCMNGKIQAAINAAATSISNNSAGIAAAVQKAGDTMSGPLTLPYINIGQNIGTATKQLVADTTTTAAIGTPTAAFFRQENYQADVNTFHLPFTFQLNSSGTGPRQTVTVQSNYDNHNPGDFVVGLQARSQMTSGSGFSIPLASQCQTSAGVGANTGCEGAEIAVEGNGSLNRNVGVNIINGWTGTNQPAVEAGLLLDSVSPSPGWRSALLFGLNQLPARAGGALIDTMTSSVALRAGIDLSKVSPGTDGTILLPYAGTVKFGNAGGSGGAIVNAGSNNGSALTFADGATILNFSGAQTYTFRPASFTSNVAIIEATPTQPASSSAPCTTGQHGWDQNYEYRCIATNTWKRAALSTW